MGQKSRLYVEKDEYWLEICGVTNNEGTRREETLEPREVAIQACLISEIYITPAHYIFYLCQHIFLHYYS